LKNSLLNKPDILMFRRQKVGKKEEKKKTRFLYFTRTTSY